MMAARNIFSIGFGATSLLGVVLVVLKLGHVIDWSWWWVSAPFWGVQMLCVASLVLAGVLGLLVGLCSTEPRAHHGVHELG